jgi:hypothetical protein
MTKKRLNILEPNPLNFYGIRQCLIPPPHFEYIVIDQQIYNLEQTIVRWITDNLKGRFYVDNVTILDASNQFQKGVKIGFENSKELSYFTLACPHLKYK